MGESCFTHVQLQVLVVYAVDVSAHGVENLLLDCCEQLSLLLLRKGSDAHHIEDDGHVVVGLEVQLVDVESGLVVVHDYSAPFLSSSSMNGVLEYSASSSSRLTPCSASRLSRFRLML